MISLDGFVLTEIGHNKWQFEAVNGASITGSLIEVVVFAIKRCHFNILEIETAVEDMLKNDYKIATFGMWGTYLYGSNPVPFKRLAS